MHSPFSNWYPSKFTVDGIEYTCSEQYYMRYKALYFHDKKSAAAIMATTSPAVMKQIGRSVKGFDKSEWDTVKTDVMRHGLTAKVCHLIRFQLFMKFCFTTIIVVYAKS